MVEQNTYEPLSYERLWEKLCEEQSKLAFHIKIDHYGYPATTCHRCINHAQKIMWAEENLQNFMDKTPE